MRAWWTKLDQLLFSSCYPHYNHITVIKVSVPALVLSEHNVFKKSVQVC